MKEVLEDSQLNDREQEAVQAFVKRLDKKELNCWPPQSNKNGKFNQI
jgi:hypothetical protein